MRLHLPHDPPSLAAIPVTKSHAFTARNYCEPNFRFLWHYHPEWELTWTPKGSGWRHVGCSVEKFGPGDLVLLGGLLPHTWVSGPEHRGEARCTVIHFLPELWGDRFWDLPEIRPLRTLCDQAVRGLRFTGPGLDKIGSKMVGLAKNGGGTFRSFAKLMEIFELLIEMPSESLNAADGDGPPKPNPRLQGLLGWIESRVGEDLTQEDAAKQVKMPPPSFSRWFKAQMGCTFQRYVTELRVARVCLQLSRSDVSVTDAAFQAGFGNIANFNRRFRDITGQTPREFRGQLMGCAGLK